MIVPLFVTATQNRAAEAQIPEVETQIPEVAGQIRVAVAQNREAVARDALSGWGRRNRRLHFDRQGRLDHRGAGVCWG